MRLLGLGLVVFACTAAAAFAAPGDQWILGIHHIDAQPSFTKYTGAGYSGPQSSGALEYVGNAYGRGGNDGIARIYWELSGNAIESGRPVPNSAQLYSLEFFGTTDVGQNDWQPVESQFHGIVGEGDHGIPSWDDKPSALYDEHIPWSGAFQSNHQFIGSDGKNDGAWHALDNGGQGGPQAPFDENMDTLPDGIHMWLTRGSWLYAKWNFTFPINRSWSALRLTQITGPEPLEGDFNNDDRVDAADYVAWRKSDIDGQDGYDTWQMNFGSANEGAGALFGAHAVPEPAGAITLALGVLSMLWRRASRRNNDLPME